MEIKFTENKELKQVTMQFNQIDSTAKETEIKQFLKDTKYIYDCIGAKEINSLANAFRADPNLLKKLPAISKMLEGLS